MASRVIAMWMIEGLCSRSDGDHVVLEHSLPFRNAGASRNAGRSVRVTVTQLIAIGKSTSRHKRKRKRRRRDDIFRLVLLCGL